MAKIEEDLGPALDGVRWAVNSHSVTVCNGLAFTTFLLRH